VYFSAKSWFFLKYKSGTLHGYKMKNLALVFYDHSLGLKFRNKINRDEAIMKRTQSHMSVCAEKITARWQ